jgi:hypothetical protein
MPVDYALCEMAHIRIGRGFCSGQNQKAKVLKIVANRWRVAVLSSKAGVHKSLIRDRNPPHNRGGGYEDPMKILYIA